MPLSFFCSSPLLPPERHTGSTSPAWTARVKPGDDFFRYANGKWFDETVIPADRSSFGTFAILAEKADKRTADLIRDLHSGKIADYYAAFMDEKAIEAQGLKPLEPELDDDRRDSTTKRRSRACSAASCAPTSIRSTTRTSTPTASSASGSSPDFDDPTRNVALPAAGRPRHARPRLLPRQGRAHGRRLQAKYREHIAAMLKLAGIADAAERAARIYDLEHQIAEAHAQPHRFRGRAQGQQSVDAAPTFAAKAPGLDWAAYFKAAGLPAQPMIMVWHPAAVTGISALAASEPLDVWKDYLTFHALDRASALLPKAFADENFKFYGTALSGAPQQRARWKRARQRHQRRPRRRRRQAVRRSTTSRPRPRPRRRRW